MEFLAERRLNDLALYLEFQRTLQHADQFVRGMDGVLAALAWRGHAQRAPAVPR
jgi:hypothetical protein